LISHLPGDRRFGAWLWPDSQSPGGLEDFVRGLVPAGDACWSRAVAATGAELKAPRTHLKSKTRAKAELHTFLAWQREPGTRYGAAVQRGFLVPSGPAVDAFLSWFRRLYAEA